MSKKTKWDDIPISVWSVVYYKEDDNGNTKFYDFVGGMSKVLRTELMPPNLLK